MSRQRLDPKVRTVRKKARAGIVMAANRYRQARNARGLGRLPFLAPALNGRHLQKAVCICRRRGLVDADVLEAAGFRAKERAQ